MERQVFCVIDYMLYNPQVNHCHVPHYHMDDKNIKNVVVRLEVFTVVKMLMVVLWVVMLCGLAGRYHQTPTFQKNLMPPNSGEEFIDQLSYYQILKKYSAPWSKLNPSSVCIKY